MTDLSSCIPRDKHDLAAVERAGEIGFPELDPILPELLEWLQDMNWPVAPPLAELLAEAGPALAPHVLSILRSDDAIWKYWVIESLAGSWDAVLWETVATETLRIRDDPTDAERDEETDIAARDALSGSLPMRNIWQESGHDAKR